MNDGRLDIGQVERIEAESFGEPGQRTFRVVAHTHQGTVSLWLEKQQLAALGSALTDLLERTPASVEYAGARTEASGIVGDLEVHVGTLALGYDANDGMFTLEASDFTSPFELTGIAIRVQREQIESLNSDIASIVSRSRPRCPLCGQPLTGGPHFCPESNGHATVAYSE